MKISKLLAAGVFAVMVSVDGATFATTLFPNNPRASQRIVADNYGGSIESDGEVDDLQNPNKSLYSINKELWIDFPSSSSNGGAQWLEMGGTKGGVAKSITIDNPDIDTDLFYYEGHFFGYNFYDTQGYVHYHEGKVGDANPTGTHTYQIQRDFSTDNRWLASLDNNPAYYLTVSTVTQDSTKYSQAAAISFGIESAETTDSFTSGTTITSVSTIPTSGTSWQLYQGTTINRDTPLNAPENYNGMNSAWVQYDGVNNRANYYHN